MHWVSISSFAVCNGNRSFGLRFCETLSLMDCVFQCETVNDMLLVIRVRVCERRIFTGRNEVGPR